MISRNEFHAICRKYGMIRIDKTNIYTMLGLKSAPVAHWYKFCECSLKEIEGQGYQRNWVWRYHIESVEDFEQSVKKLVEQVKKLALEHKMQQIEKDF